jgi:hypothetical protein
MAVFEVLEESGARGASFGIIADCEKVACTKFERQQLGFDCRAALSAGKAACHR